MGHGDQILGSGLARGAYAQGELVAFGDGSRIIFDHNSELIFRNNPNIAFPGAERGEANFRPELKLRWVPFYRGNRLYNRDDTKNERWIWNMEFRPTPGELFFSREEQMAIAEQERDFILIEPNVPPKRSGPNKLWPLQRYQAVANMLKQDGYQIAQFRYSGIEFGLSRVTAIDTKNFRRALGMVGRAKLVITCEGGLHHGAAAMGVPAVVLFGGFIPASVTGYPTHENIAAEGEACGKYVPCEHCTKAMASIEPEQVYEAAKRLLG